MRLWTKALAACVLAVALAGCGDSAVSEQPTTPPEAATAQPTATTQAAAAAEPTATPTATPKSAPTPAVEADAGADAAPQEPAPTRTQSIILYDLTEIEKTCPGYQEFTGFRQTVSQVKITCTSPGVETVYFVDLDNLVVTGIRVPLLEPEIP